MSVSCSKYQKLRKSIDCKLKYEAAMKYYEKRFARAFTLFEDILPIIRTKEAESANFHAYAHFYQDLYSKRHYFETFLEIYSR